MKKRILFVGGGAPMARAVVAAAHLGYHTVAVDNTPRSAVIAAAQEGIAADISDPAELTRVARSARVDGIFPPLEPNLMAAAAACAELRLPGLAPDRAALTLNKHALRQAGGNSVAQPMFCTATTDQEARAAAETVGLPVIVKPADGFGSVGVRQVEHVEDMPLAFVQAAKASSRGLVLVESVVEGRRLTVDGTVQCGAFRVVAASGAIPSSPPCCYAQAAYAPVEGEVVMRLADAADSVARGLRINSGFFSVEFIVTAHSCFLVELHAYPSHLRLPADLLRLATGVDSTAAVLNACTGEPPSKPIAAATAAGSAAIVWMQTHSGVVTEIEGLGDARAVKGVVEVKVVAKPGDIIGHVVDAVTRDKVGYAIATGSSAGEALDAATKACELCRIVTSPALG